jgi:hypothetical protein
VNAHGGVELGLGGARLHGDGQALDQLGRVVAHHVHADHPVGRGLDDQLHEGALLAAGERVLHRREGRAKTPDLAQAASCLFLGQADIGELGLAEHGRRHVRDGRLARLLAEFGSAKQWPSMSATGVR